MAAKETGEMAKKTIVVALGGNALLRRSDPMTAV
jgi:hypothetical protein